MWIARRSDVSIEAEFESCGYGVLGIAAGPGPDFTFLLANDALTQRRDGCRDRAVIDGDDEREDRSS